MYVFKFTFDLTHWMGLVIQAQPKWKLRIENEDEHHNVLEIHSSFN